MLIEKIYINNNTYNTSCVAVYLTGAITNNGHNFHHMNNNNVIQYTRQKCTTTKKA